MLDLGWPLGEGVGPFLELLVGPGEAFAVLAQVLGPGPDHEGLDEVVTVGPVAVQVPAGGAGALA